LKSKSRKCWKNDHKKIKDKLDTKNKWNKNLRGGIEKKSTLKPIKAKQIRIKIDINTNWWTHLILKWMAWNLRWCERKDGGKKNLSEPNCCSTEHMFYRQEENGTLLSTLLQKATLPHTLPQKHKYLALTDPYVACTNNFLFFNYIYIC
jgi:hypothetical protein